MSATVREVRGRDVLWGWWDVGFAKAAADPATRDLPVVEIVVPAGRSPGAEDLRPLQDTCVRAALPLVRALIERGAVPLLPVRALVRVDAPHPRIAHRVALGRALERVRTAGVEIDDLGPVHTHEDTHAVTYASVVRVPGDHLAAALRLCFSSGAGLLLSGPQAASLLRSEEAVGALADACWPARADRTAVSVDWPRFVAARCAEGDIAVTGMSRSDDPDCRLLLFGARCEAPDARTRA